MGKRAVIILSVLLTLVAAATAVSIVVALKSNYDIDKLQDKVTDINNALSRRGIQGQSQISVLTKRVDVQEKQIAAANDNIKKALNPNNPTFASNVSLTDLLNTVNQNASTANQNYSEIQSEVSRLQGKLEDEQKVAGEETDSEN